MRLDPFSPTRQVKVIFDGAHTKGFFTNTQGKHQMLSNGNLLIVEYTGGRVLESDSSGKVVWEYVNKYDDEAGRQVVRRNTLPARLP